MLGALLYNLLALVSNSSPGGSGLGRILYIDSNIYHVILSGKHIGFVISI